jgi:hypothetical protein
MGFKEILSPSSTVLMHLARLSKDYSQADLQAPTRCLDREVRGEKHRAFWRVNL